MTASGLNLVTAGASLVVFENDVEEMLIEAGGCGSRLKLLFKVLFRRLDTCVVCGSGREVWWRGPGMQVRGDYPKSHGRSNLLAKH